MSDGNSQFVMYVFSFTLVMSIHVLVWIFMKNKINEDMDEAYSYVSNEVNIDVLTYIKNIIMLKRNNVPELPFSILKITIYIIFSYLTILFILLITYILVYLLHILLLTGCVKNKIVTSDNLVLNILKEYVLKHFTVIVETICICICIIVILSIIIEILLKPAMLSKENTKIVVDSIMFMFLISIPFNMIANSVIIWVLSKESSTQD